MNTLERFSFPNEVWFKRYYFGLTKGEFGFLVLLSAFLIFIFSFAYDNQPGWMITGIVFSGFVLIHVALTNGRYIVVPGFASLVACVQWIIAPWLAYLYPPTFERLLFAEMAVPPERYFAFAVPATMALWLGLHLPLWRTIRKKLAIGINLLDNQVPPLSVHQRLLMDIFIGFGIILSLVSAYLPSSYQLGFFYYTLANLRFVGALYWMLTNTKGWKLRVGLVLAVLVIQVAPGGVFYEPVLWFAYLLITRAYLRKWNWKILPIFFVIFVLFFVLNTVKATYFLEVRTRDLSSKEKQVLLERAFFDSFTLREGFVDYLEKRGLGDGLVRYNQGWIIARVMSRVPYFQPYGGGETVVAAFKDSFVPRVIFPGKFSDSPKEIFEKYTGHNPGEASMGLGISGEMYANFGQVGGVAATFIYALFIFTEMDI